MGWKNGQKVQRTRRTEEKKTWNSRTSKRYDERRELKWKRHRIEERAKVQRKKKTEEEKTWDRRTDERYNERRKLKKKDMGNPE